MAEQVLSPDTRTIPVSLKSYAALENAAHIHASLRAFVKSVRQFSVLGLRFVTSKSSLHVYSSWSEK